MIDPKIDCLQFPPSLLPSNQLELFGPQLLVSFASCFPILLEVIRKVVGFIFFIPIGCKIKRISDSPALSLWGLPGRSMCLSSAQPSV